MKYEQIRLTIHKYLLYNPQMIKHVHSASYQCETHYYNYIRKSSSLLSIILDTKTHSQNHSQAYDKLYR